jgi:hypothetical protein
VGVGVGLGEGLGERLGEGDGLRLGEGFGGGDALITSSIEAPPSRPRG